MNIAEKRAAKRALKNVSVQQLETAISAALYKLTAATYHVDIKRLDLAIDPGDGQAHHDGAVIEMNILDACPADQGAEPGKLQAAQACDSLRPPYGEQQG